MSHNIILKFHEWENFFPNITEDGVECSKCQAGFNYMGNQYLFTEYSFEYQANSAIGCCWCCCPTSECLGYHEGDVEKIILLDDDTGKTHYVYFKAHGRGEGMWMDYDDCEKNDNNDLIVYVARGSHAFYPHPEVYWRIFGFANDLCSNRGQEYKINPIKEHNIPFNPPQISVQPWERVLIPLTLNRIREK